MANEKVTALFSTLHSSVEILQKELDMSYLESLVETGENILDGKEPRIIDGKPSEEAAKELRKLYATVSFDEMSAEEIRQAVQLAILKGTKEDYLQPNHQMTPDAIGLLVVYLIRTVFKERKESVKILDPAVGTANLLSVVYNQLRSDGLQVSAEGIDNDDLLLSIAAVNIDLQGLEDIRLTHHDALGNLLVEPSDLVISDLPVGYYPLDTNAAKFETSFEEGNSYSHYLFIEQGLTYLKNDGFAFFIVPANLFQMDESKTLLSYIQKVAYFQGFIQLPKEFFKNEQSRKAILMLQKKGAQAQQAKEVLLAVAPDFRERGSLQRFIAEVVDWKEKNLK